MDPIVTAITTALTGVAIAFCLRAARKAPVVQGEVIVLRYAKWMRWVMRGAAIAFLVFGGVTVGLAFADGATPKDERSAWLALLVAVPFGVGGFCEPRVYLVLDAEGIRGRTAFRGHRAIAWADVVRFGYGVGSGSWVLRDRRGEVLRVPRYLVGSEAVLTALEAHVHPSIWKSAVEKWQKRFGKR